jgi:hypothetical protein
MDHSTRRLFLIWLATSAAVAVTALVAYQSVIRVPELAGRTSPETLLENPEMLFEDPGLLGTAVEIRVTRAISSCMAARGFEYRGPAVVKGLDEVLDPETDGYGIATGPAGGEVILGEGGADRSDREAYEVALYGGGLASSTSPGGCAAVGEAELTAALATIASLPYSIEQLEADTLAHPAMVSGLQAWSSCMAGRGYSANSPADLIADLTDRLSRATPDEARALAEEERLMATADFACRKENLDPATEVVAAALAPAFVAANREELESLMPPEPVDPGGFTVPTDLGSGDIQVTLFWTAPVDLDLKVTDPDGFQISYSDRTSPSGGRLDRDANYPCATDITPSPVENIFWPEGEASRGTYGIQVWYASPCSTAGGPVDFTLIVRVGGRTVIEESRSLDSSGSSYTTEVGF